MTIYRKRKDSEKLYTPQISDRKASKLMKVSDNQI
jgi:hypothetical protein